MLFDSGAEVEIDTMSVFIPTTQVDRKFLRMAIFGSALSRSVLCIHYVDCWSGTYVAVEITSAVTLELKED